VSQKRKRRYNIDDINDEDDETITFRDIFADIDREFERLQRQMDKVFAKTTRNELLNTRTRTPFIYGFTMRLGPNGKPQFHKFGTTRLSRKGMENLRVDSDVTIDEREPLTDIIETDESIAITIELPGVEKEDIDLEVFETEAIIKVDTLGRKYYKQIGLPCAVIPSSTRATYKNGILDISIEKRAKVSERKRTHVKID
jgi:HSP20 family protein